MYTVYKTVNLVNKKFYIGVHKTENPMDGYLGSGTLLKRAIKKHGLENFEKEVLFEFQDAADAFAKEAELVTKELIESGISYNLKLGGEGGFDWINKNPELLVEVRRKGGKATFAKNLTAGLKPSAEGLARRIAFNAGNKYSLGSKRTESTKKKMSDSNIGFNNSQFGSYWINNGISAKKHRGDIPEGWVRGRKF